jgi:hypothetical protein
MKTIKELLQETDSLNHEPLWTAAERDAIRQNAVLAASRGGAKRNFWSRPSLLIASVMFVVVMLAVAFGYGPRMWSQNVQAAVHFEMRLAENNPAPGLTAAIVAGSGRTVYLHEEVLITNSDLTQAVVTSGRAPGTFNVEVVFNAASTERIMRATADHIGRPIALLIDGSVVNAPTIRSAIGGSAIINGDFTKADAEMMAAGIEKR